MSRLVSPEIPIGAQPVDFGFQIPRAGISRDEYLKEYRLSMQQPLPESKSLEGELRGWSGALGPRPWVGERYSPTVALLVQNRRVMVADPDVIDMLGDACREAIAPLSCYSAGWFSSLAPLIPSGLRRPIGTAVREARRAAVRKVRGAMVDSDPPVDESFDSVQAFLRSPAGREVVDGKAALDGFVSAIVRLLDAGAAGSTVLTEDETVVLAELCERVVDDFGAEPDEPLSPERRAELRETAVAFTEGVLADWIKGKDRSDPCLTEAFERVVTTYVNRLHRGKPLVGTEYYLKLRLDAARIDERRRTAARKRRETPLVRDDWSGDRAEGATDAVPNEATNLFADAAAIIADDLIHRIDGQLCWEARTAIALLADAANLDIGTPSEVRRTVADLWHVEKPTDARSESSKAAGMDVLLILRTSVTRVRLSVTDTMPGEVS